MKLEPRPRNRRAKASEVLRVAEERPESDFFDPRFDLPAGETQRMIDMIERGQEPINNDEYWNLQKIVWLIWVDQKYQAALRQQDHFKQDGLIITSENIIESYDDLDLVLQVHPEYRSRFLAFLNRKQFSNHVKSIEEKDIFTKPTKMNAILRMVRLWPERKAEIQEHFFPSASRLAVIESYLGQRESHWSKIVFAGDFVLLFPELRDQILHKVKTELHKRTVEAELTQLRRNDDFQMGFGQLQMYLASLTILSARQAFIDEQGVVRVELPPLPVGKREPLPARPLA